MKLSFHLVARDEFFLNDPQFLALHFSGLPLKDSLKCYDIPAAGILQ